MWRLYHSIAPPTFQKNWLKNPNKFHSLLWEMILGCRFIQNGFEVIAAKDDNGPDLCLRINGRRVWVECIVPTRGSPTCPGYLKELPVDRKMHLIDSDRNTLRCINALTRKKRQYNRWLKSGICKSNEPYIIAISGILLDFHLSQDFFPDITRALYATGDPFITLSNDLDSENNNVNYEIQTEVSNDNHTTVPCDFFLDTRNKNISGVIYSTDRVSQYSSGPDYCYVRNVHSPHQTNWNFDKFMQTYN